VNRAEKEVNLLIGEVTHASSFAFREQKIPLSGHSESSVEISEGRSGRAAIYI
jgi:hypothetical protein